MIQSFDTDSRQFSKLAAAQNFAISAILLGIQISSNW